MKHRTNVQGMWSPAPTRRRAVLAASLALALLPALGPGGLAYGQARTVPDAVRTLDVAATDLFDAAEAGKWDEAANALRRVQAIAPGVSDLQSAYLEAGGNSEGFFQVVNNLSADVMEAGTALSTQDRRWLVNCADRIASRAGELSRPFDRLANAVIPRIDTLLFLTRRMRRAIVWQDSAGLVTARDAFALSWSAVRRELAGKHAPAVEAVQGAWTDLGKSPSPGEIKRLYDATRALGAVAA